MSKSCNRRNLYQGETTMTKRPLITTMTHLVRGASFLVLLFVALNLICLAQGQSLNSNSSQISRGDPRNANGAKTFVKVHDNAQRTQIGSPHQNYSLTTLGA